MVTSLRHFHSSTLHSGAARVLALLLFVLLAGVGEVEARPHITSLNPASGPVGASVTIIGSNFGARQGTSTVKFSGTLATVLAWSSTNIRVTVPSHARTGNVVVTVGGSTSNGIVFTVIPTPSVSKLSPTFGPIGTSVTLTGTNFGATQGTSTVTFNGIAGTPANWSNTSIAVLVPNGATTGSVLVKVNGVTSNGVIFTVTQGALSVAVSPKRAAVTMSASQTAQFTTTVLNDPTNAGVTWQVDGSNGGNVTTGTVSSAGLFTPGTQPGQHAVTAVSNANASVSASSMIAVTDLAGVYTHHNDNARTGQNLKEYGLTPVTVSSTTFGQLFSCQVDGYVYAEPLWVANLNFGGTMHNVLFIATEHDSVYAFDADSPSCVQLWQVSFLGSGVNPFSPSDINGNGDIVPEIGITSTPVIDPSTNTIYVVPKTTETAGTVSGQACSTSSPCYVHRLHALDLITGAEKFGGPTVISAPNFTPLRQLQRPALLLANNTVYVTFGAHGDQCNYAGWVMGYNPSTLAQIFANPLTDPTLGNCNKGGIWQGGAGPATDASGNVYVNTGNGVYDGAANYGDSAVKLSPTGSILDWFTPFNQATFDANDIDLASAGVLILPDSVGSSAHPHLALSTGKVAILYLLDQMSMGKNNPSTNNDVQEVVPVPPANTTLSDGGNYGNVAYWNGNIYTTGQNFPLSQFQIANGAIATPQFATSTNTFPARGGIPAVSANGTAGGVVWIIDYTGWQNGTASILDAYDATNVGTLLFSSPGTGTGSAGLAVKFTTPTVANGRVYVGGQYSFSVFGLLPN
jgi:hypothetical protein